MKVAVIGGTGGLGRSISRFLAAHSADVLVVGQTFRDEGVKGIDFLKADLSSLKEMKRIGASLPAEGLDAIIFTTGIITTPERQVTVDGIERDLATSFISRYVILESVADRLGKGRSDPSRRPRVFIYGFPGTNAAADLEDLNSEKKYKPWDSHMYTVAGNEALVLSESKKYPHLGIFGVNPGLIATNIRSNVFGSANSYKFRIMEWFIRKTCISSDDYATKITPILFSPDLETKSGIHINNKGFPILPSTDMSPEKVDQVMEATRSVMERGRAPEQGEASTQQVEAK